MYLGFTVYEVSELEYTMNSLCPWPKFANQGVQNLRDVQGSLQRLPCHANPTVSFAHFVGADVLFYSQNSNRNEARRLHLRGIHTQSSFNTFLRDRCSLGRWNKV